jgi:ssDNA-binding Zn-finger/Zn-ribbon topoisomerase 1
MPKYKKEKNIRSKNLFKSRIKISNGGYCPSCISKGKMGVMVVRSGLYGAFEGCSNFPDCRRTKKI